MEAGSCVRGAVLLPRAMCLNAEKVVPRLGPFHGRLVGTSAPRTSPASSTALGRLVMQPRRRQIGFSRTDHPRCFITSVWPQPGASNELHMLLIYLHSPHSDVHCPYAPRPWFLQTAKPAGTHLLTLVDPSLSCPDSPAEQRCPLTCFG